MKLVAADNEYLMSNERRDLRTCWVGAYHVKIYCK